MALAAEKTRVVTSIAPATNAEARGLRDAVAESGAHLLEIRFDGFAAEEPDLAGLRETFRDRTLVGTLRTRGQGGRYDGPREAVAPFLSRLLGAGFDLVDVEHGGGELPAGLDPSRVIASFHDLTGIPVDLDGLLDSMERTSARYTKIVGTAADSGDALRLLAFQRRRADGRLSAFAMGEAGIATRVLSPYVGAALAYGSLSRGAETAPGQVPAADLAEVYGIGRARVVERVYALFGGVVSHSFSPALHNSCFLARKVPALYVPFALRSLLKEFDPLVVAFDGLRAPLKGASVTIPFKDEAASVALRGESVANTLLRSGDAFTAENTDRRALASFLPLRPGSAALVLGAGGTARAAVEALVSRRYRVSITSRSPERAEALARETSTTAIPEPADGDFTVLVNATPLGMKSGDRLPMPEGLLRGRPLVIDAPYRLGGTELSRAARAAGCVVIDGLSLLAAQAALQAELFTGKATTKDDLLSFLPERIARIFEVTE